MVRAFLLLAFMSACAPKDPSGPGSEGGSESGTGSGASATASPTTGGESSGGESTGGESSGQASTGPGSTGEASSSGGSPVCAWYDPANQSYCPLLAAPNIELTGDTPMGPATFKYAYFGLFLCASCPEPDEPALGLFAEAQSPGLEPLVGDYLLFRLWSAGQLAEYEGRIGGQPIALGQAAVSFPELMVATEEQTTPPLDPAAPPTMAGTISVIGDGWMLAGEFTASLCTGLDWTPPCE